MDTKAILDFEGEGLEDLKEKLINAIKKESKIYPVEVTPYAEYDEVGLMLSIKDKEGNFYSIGNLKLSSMDFNQIADEIGYEPRLKEPSEEEKKEIEEDYKDSSKTHPFTDEVKEVEKQKIKGK